MYPSKDYLIKILCSMLVLLICLPAAPVLARETHVLTLTDCQHIGRQRSYQMRTLQEDYQIARLELRAAVNRFKTQANLSLTAPDYSETIGSLQDSTGTHYFPVEQAVYSGNLQISQPLPTDGSIYLSAGVYHIQDYFERDESFRLNTRVGLEQPIEALYSYNRIQAAYKLAELNYELARRRLTRAQLDLDYAVSQAFYNLILAIERLNISAQTLHQQEEACQLAGNKYKAGVIAEVEALQMEVDLGEAQNNFDIARAEREAQANYLKQLLNFNLADSLVLRDDLSYQPVTVDLEKALQFGLKNRLEIREKEIQTEQARIEIEGTRVDHQIRGKISAYYDFIGVNQQEQRFAWYSTFGNAWEELKKRPGNRGVSLQLTIPLWDWGVNDARVQAAQARLRQAGYSLDDEKMSVERDIRNTVNNLNSSLKRLQLLEKNVRVAERSFEISKKRFANGDINSQSLALDRNRLSQAYNSRLNALISYKLLLADLTRKTFYDFAAGRPVSAGGPDFLPATDK